MTLKVAFMFVFGTVFLSSFILIFLFRKLKKNDLDLLDIFGKSVLLGLSFNIFFIVSYFLLAVPEEISSSSSDLSTFEGGYFKVLKESNIVQYQVLKEGSDSYKKIPSEITDIRYEGNEAILITKNFEYRTPIIPFVYTTGSEYELILPETQETPSN